MRVLVLSSTFPNPKQPTLGVFIRERMSRVARQAEIRVVAPIPWFPFNGRIRGDRWVGIPRVEWQDGLEVHHPPFFCVPRYHKWLDGATYAVSLLPYLRRLRREFPFDAIDAHFAYPDGMAGILLGRALGLPVMITLRGSIVRLVTYPLHRPQIRYALTRAARVLAVSRSLRDVAVSLGVPTERIRVVPNGVDVERFHPRDREAARRAVGLPVDRTIVLSVGGLNEGKGHHRVVAALPELVRRHPDLLYVVVGVDRPSDSSRPLIEREVARTGLEGRVLLAGERPHGEIPLWLAAANVFCLATRSEGWANVLLESLACGVPVVSTRVGGNSEIVTHPGLGTLVPANDDPALASALREALQRDWDRGALVAHARAHSWDSAVTAVLEELRAMTGPGGTAGLPLAGLTREPERPC